METIGTSLKTIFAKFQQVKKDTGEVNKDFSQTINTLEQFGVKTGSLEGQLKPVGEILQELASKWNDMNDKQKAMVSSSLGVYQISRFSALMQGLAKDVNGVSRSQQIYSEVMNASGETNKQYEVYLNSLSGAIDKFKAQWEVVFNNSMNSGTLKSIVDMGTGLLNITDKIGGLNIVLASLGFVLLSSSEKFKTFKNSLISIKTTQDGLSHSILINGKSLKDLKLAFTNASAGGNIFRGMLNMLKVGLTSLKLKAIGAKIAVEGLKMALTMGLSVALTLATEWIMKVITGTKEAKKANQELQQSVQQNIKSNNDMITYLQTEGKEYDNLSKKTKLTTEEQEKLKNIKQQISDKFPELVKGINYETGEIELQCKSTKELIELLKHKNKLENYKIVDKGDSVLKDKQEEYKQIQDEIYGLQAKNSILQNGGNAHNPTRDSIQGLLKIKEVRKLTTEEETELNRKLEEQQQNYGKIKVKIDEAKSKAEEFKTTVNAIYDIKNLDEFQRKLANISIDPSKFVKNDKMQWEDLLVEIQQFKEKIENDSNYTTIKMVAQLDNPKESDLKKYFDSIMALSKTLKMSPLELTKIMPLKVDQEYLKKNSKVFVKVLTDEIKKASGQDKIDLSNMIKMFDGSKVAEEVDKVSQATYDLNKQQKIAEERFKGSMDSIKDYNGYLAEIKDNNHLSAESMSEIIDRHSELIPYLGDTKTLYNKIQQAEEDEKNNAIHALQEKLSNNVSFFANIKTGYKDMFAQIDSAYGTDLQNFKTVAELKATVDNILRGWLGEAWQIHYKTMAEGIKAVRESVNKKFLDSKINGTAFTMTEDQKAQYQQLAGYDKIMGDIETKINNVANSMSDVKFPKPNFSKIGGGRGKKSKGSRSSKSKDSPIIYNGKELDNYEAKIKDINSRLEDYDKNISNITQKITNLKSIESKSNYADVIDIQNKKLTEQRKKLHELELDKQRSSRYKNEITRVIRGKFKFMKSYDLDKLTEEGNELLKKTYKKL